MGHATRARAPGAGPDATGGAGERVNFLDGIRGWASFAVLLSHSLVYFLARVTEPLRFDRPRLAADLAAHDYLDVCLGMLLRTVSNGRLAVLVFFVLSGYALSVGHLQPDGGKLARAAASRYFRLLIPILFTSLVAYTLLRFGLMFNLEAAATSDRLSDWLATFYRFDASLLGAIRFSFYDVFFNYDVQTTYNSSLWTMPVEITGSFLIYSYLALFRTTTRIPARLACILTLLLYATQPWLSCFMIGYVMAEVTRRYTAPALCRKLRLKFPDVTLICVAIAAAVLSTYMKDNIHVDCVLAAIVVFSVACSTTLRSVFSGGISHGLGLISFPLYLIQVPIICSWSSYLYLKLPLLGLGAIQANLLNLASTIGLCLVAATALVPVERLSVSVSKRIGRALVG